MLPPNLQCKFNGDHFFKIKSYIFRGAGSSTNYQQFGHKVFRKEKAKILIIKFEHFCLSLYKALLSPGG